MLTPSEWLLAGIILFLLIVIAALIYIGRRIKRADDFAVLDAATGALNSEGLRRASAKYLKGKDLQYAVVVMQLKNYRQLNQTFGVENSDRTMKYLAGHLRKILGASEPSARVSRNVFCFLMKNRTEEAVKARLQRIFENANQFNHGMKVPYQLDLIFGIYFPKDDTESFGQMKEMALQMLELGKDEPRYRFCRLGTAEENGIRRWELIQQTDRSLKNGDFIVYMQPKVRLGDGRIMGAEALVRWRHPQRGLLTPEMFVPLLEEYHLIDRFDQYVFEQVLARMAEWKKAGWADCPISVNLSLETIENEDFMDPYVKLSQKYRISPELIEFELSEPILFEAPEKLRAVIDSIHRYGFRCSLDHFGQTAIPLQLLRELEVDTLKLDRSFFTGENNSRPNRSIVEAIIKITSQLQIHTVAEGIDNATQVQYLRQLGCDMIQGFYYFKPMPPEEFQKTVFDHGQLRYVDKQEKKPGQVKEAVRSNGSNIIMFTFMETQDRVVFSDVFSPLLYGQLSINEASALFAHSDLIHENDRKDFMYLLERCRKEEGWVENTIRFYTSEARYEWLEVHMHYEHISSGGESVICGTMVNMAGWKNEVNRWMEKANRDPLTGLFNREYFEQYASSTIEKGGLTSGAIIFFDLDNFKQVNDTLGHMVGDDVLCFIAKRMLGAFRHSDVIARYGGDEFVAFVNNIERSDLEKRLEELCKVLQTPYRNDTIEYRISGSIGAAVFPDDGDNYQSLLDHADTATYVAKEQGKAQYVFYHPGMEEDLQLDRY